MSMSAPHELPFSGDPRADELLAREPMALLIGFVLDQQVSVQKAFSGPLELQRRVGSIEAAAIAAMDPDDLEAVFRAQPALHRFPADMARRTRALCAVIVETYGGDARRIWTEAADGPDLEARLLALPGIGAMKAKALLVILSRRFGLRLPGLDASLPDYATLGDVDSAAALAAYQAQKRAAKQARKAGAAGAAPTGGGSDQGASQALASGVD
jgi:uncharacterized HhH-GPD family protein